MNYSKQLIELINNCNTEKLKSYIIQNEIIIESIKNKSFDILVFAIEANIPLKSIKYIVNDYKNLNYEIKGNKIPLFLALQKNDFSLANLLLNNKADINYVDSFGKNALFYLLYYGCLNENNLKYILTKNINVNFQDNNKKRIMDYLAHTQQMNLIKIIIDYTIYNNNLILNLVKLSKNQHKLSLKAIDKILETEKEKLHITKFMYLSTIHHNNVPLFKLLLENDSKKSVLDIVKGYHLIVKATEIGNFTMIKYLLDQGANIDDGDAKGNTALIIASKNGNIDIVKFLIENDADIHLKNKNGNNALMIAIKYNQFLVVKYLITYGTKINEGNYSGWTPLMIASRNNNLDLVKYLRANGALIQAKNNSGWTPLMAAAESGNVEIVKYFIQCHANVNECNKNQWNSLMIAAGKGHLSIVKELLQCGAKENINAKDNIGWTALIIAVQNGFKSIVECLVEDNSSVIDINLEANNQSTALTYACHCHQTEIVSYLLNHGANINHKNEKGQTPLLISIQNNYVDLVQLLLEKGANPNDVDNEQETTLIYAIKNISKGEDWTEVKKIVDCLFMKNSSKFVNKKNKEGDSALILASKIGHMNAIKYLIEKVGASINISDCNGNTALMIAAFNNRLDIVKYLIQKNADIYHISNNGSTAIMAACQSGNKDVVQLLIENGENINRKDVNGYSLLMMASQNNHVDIVRYLLEKGSSIYEKNSDGNTALIIASANGHDQVVSLLLNAYRENYTPPKHKPRHSILINNNNDDIKNNYIEANNKLSYNSLMYASENGHLNVVKLLVKNYANVNAKNLNDDTPLMLATKRGFLDIVKYLVENRAYLNLFNKQGDTPLLYAVKKGYFDIMKYLIEHGVDINNCRTRQGSSPLLIAVENGYERIVKYLVEHGANINDRCRSNGFLMKMVEKKYVGLINYFVEDILKKEDYGSTPLMIASGKGNKEIVKYLIENGAKVNEKNGNCWTSLTYAFRNGHDDVANYLKANGANLF